MQSRRVRRTLCMAILHLKVAAASSAEGISVRHLSKFPGLRRACMQRSETAKQDRNSTSVVGYSSDGGIERGGNVARWQL